MKANEFVSMSNEQLTATVAELKKELFNLRFQLATGQLQNTAAINECRKDIARVKTVIREMSEKA